MDKKCGLLVIKILHHPTRRMNGVNDSLLIAILLSLIFGAVAFYLYSRIEQTEKRLGLMENLLLQLKFTTEASLEGPESVHAVSEGSPLKDEDVESVDAEEYSEMLKEIPIETGNINSIEQVIAPMDEDEDNKEESPAGRVEVNYEAMSLNELKALAKQKGLSGIQQKKKKELIDLLKQNGGSGDVPIVEEGLGGVEIGENGFPVEMSSS